MGISERLAIVGFALIFSWSDSVAKHPNAKQSETQSSDGTAPSSECPILFGDDNAHEQNKLFREKFLKSVREYEHSIVVVHHTDWDKPQLIDYMGIKLVDTELDDESGPIAIFHVSEEKDFGCDPGLYAVHVNDAIGSEASVLAILSGVVLIENEDQLRYMNVEDAKHPNWRMVWASRWKIIRMPKYRSSGRRVTPKPPRKPRRSPRHTKHKRSRKR